MRVYTLFYMMMLSSLAAFSQKLSPTVLPGAGAYNSAGGVTLSWTLGQTASATLQNGSLVLTQGEQQPLPFYPLPLTWLSVNGDLNQQQQAIITFTVEEQNVSGFSIEKQTGAGVYVSIGYMRSSGNGTHTYQFTEPTALNGDGYYRVKQIDADGHATYSRVVYLKNKAAGRVLVYPNPVSTKTGLYVTDATLINTSGMLMDLRGRILLQFKVQPYTEIDLSPYAQGTYMIQLQNGFSAQLVKVAL